MMKKIYTLALLLCAAAFTTTVAQEEAPSVVKSTAAVSAVKKAATAKKAAKKTAAKPAAKAKAKKAAVKPAVKPATKAAAKAALALAKSTTTAVVELLPETTVQSVGDIVIMNNNEDIPEAKTAAAPQQTKDDSSWQSNVNVVPYDAQGDAAPAEDADDAPSGPVEPPVSIKQTIPLSYGLLKGVAPQGSSVLLFFEDNLGTVRVVPLQGAGDKTALQQPVAIERSAE